MGFIIKKYVKLWAFGYKQIYHKIIVC